MKHDVTRAGQGIAQNGALTAVSARTCPSERLRSSLRPSMWIWLSLSWLVIVCVPLAARSQPQERALRPPVPLLWQVSDGNARLYLLGSFHLLKKDDYPLSADVDRAFADARRLAFELAPDEVDSPALARRMLQAAQRQDGRSLQQELDAATWRKLQDYAGRHELSLQTLQSYRPWFVGLTVSLASMAQQGMDPALGLDRHFMQLARASGKATSGLERADEQIALLAGMSSHEQQQMLDEALEDSDAEVSEIDRLHAAWRRGEVALLTQWMAQDMQRHYPALYRRINIERNDNWIPKLERMLLSSPREGNALVVVGALHLLGEDGVVEKLRARGYRVERICSACTVASPR